MNVGDAEPETPSQSSHQGGPKTYAPSPGTLLRHRLVREVGAVREGGPNTHAGEELLGLTPMPNLLMEISLKGVLAAPSQLLPSASLSKPQLCQSW